MGLRCESNRSLCLIISFNRSNSNVLIEKLINYNTKQATKKKELCLEINGQFENQYGISSSIRTIVLRLIQMILFCPSFL